MRRYVEIELSHLSLSRNEREVLKDVNWRIRRGERWVLIGANGSGKTQLLKVLAGDVWPSPDKQGRRQYRFQGQTYCDPYGVREEIAYVGAERQDKYERYGWDFEVSDLIGTGINRTDIPLHTLEAADRRRIGALLGRFGLMPLASRKFFTLSYGQRRLVLLARALATRPKLLLLDELFEGLDRERHALVSRWLESTARTGIPWVLATHRQTDVPVSATHVATLENGRLTLSGAKGALRRIARKKPGARAFRAPARQARRVHARRALLVRLTHATVYLGESPVLRDISLDVHAGDCWLVHGANGSGKTTLLRTIYGDHGVGKSAIQRFGIEPGVPLERFKRRVGWVAPSLQSDHPLTMTVAEVMQSGRYASIGLNEAPTATDRAAAHRALARLGLEALEERTLRELSYGQMRRVLFARAWVRAPKLLLLDEPLAGVDTATRRELGYDIERAVWEGIAVVMTTHHADEWPAEVTHELELRDGEAVYCGPARARFVA